MENIEAPVVDWIRSLGDDVFDVRSSARGADDADLLAMAVEDGRVFLTYDLDFGELAFRQRRPHAGIILLRLTEGVGRPNGSPGCNSTGHRSSPVARGDLRSSIPNRCRLPARRTGLP